MVESPSVAVPAAPNNIQSFIDPNGFMSTTWNETGGGVVQYNMQYRVQNSDDANDITIPMGVTNSNVSNLAIMVLYEVSMNVHTYVSQCIRTYTTKYEINVLYEVSTYVHMYIHPTMEVICSMTTLLFSPLWCISLGPGTRLLIGTTARPCHHPDMDSKSNY